MRSACSSLVAGFFVVVIAVKSSVLADGNGLERVRQHEPKMSYLDNGVVKVGVDLNLGGSITYLSKSGVDQNMVNSWDFGRQIQMSYYAGPVPFAPDGKHPKKEWDFIGWNPIQSGDAFGNAMRSREFEHAYQVGKLGGPIRRWEWGMTPMTINAYSNSTMVEIVFPAAILQPPFFDPNADAAVNYGGIGAVIGHEMSHQFDDQGSKFDLHGNLIDWWTPGDSKQFTARLDKYEQQINGYEPLPGMHVKGGLTLGENIGDLAGLTAAHDAYVHSLGGKEPPVIDGTTADQRFYLGWAQVWRRNYREANLRQRLITDPHSPSEQRAWVVRNLDPWYPAFDVKPGQKLYLAPEQRVRMW